MRISSNLMAVLSSIYDITKAGNLAKTDVVKRECQLGDLTSKVLKQAQEDGLVNNGGVRGTWVITKKGLPYVDQSTEVEVYLSHNAQGDTMTVDKPTSRSLININADTSAAEALVRKIGYGRVKVQKVGAVVTFRGKLGRIKYTPEADGKWAITITTKDGGPTLDELAELLPELNQHDNCLHLSDIESVIDLADLKGVL